MVVFLHRSRQDEQVTADTMPKTCAKSEIEGDMTRKIFVIGFLAVAMSVSNCTDAKDVITPQELLALCNEAGFVPLPLPDTRITPGAIVNIRAETVQPGVLGYLSSCNYPPDVLTPIEGRMGQFQVGSEVETKVEALLKLKNIEAGPKVGQVKRILLQVENAGISGLNFIEITKWADAKGTAGESNYHKIVNASCRTAFEKENTYVVGEAFQLRSGRYALYDNKNAELKLKGANIGEVLKFEPGFDFSRIVDGKLSVDEPTAICVRNVTWFGQGYQAPGLNPPKEKTADNVIQEQFLEQWK